MDKEENKKSIAAEREEKILEFWQRKQIFEKTLSSSQGKKEFIFYEGPPTANGKPGIHHLEARAFKDAVPRYKTMQGFHVRRKGGWDTHGLPVELQVEKKLGLNSKKAIEAYGIAKFNQECKESVWQHVDLWEKFTDRIGYWVDQEHPYVTYHNPYIESVWNIVKKVEEQKLLYKDYKVVPWCPRCGTALSSHELAQGYQDDTDLSVTVKFKVVGQENTYLLAWTTTPWTLPGNVGLAVGKDIEYVKIQKENDNLILAKLRLSIIDGEYKVVEEQKGSDLVGLEYEPLYPFTKEKISGAEKDLPAQAGKMQNAYKVYPADFVTTEDGTGIVHTAVMYGQDDFELGTKVGLPKFHLVNPDGTFIAGTDFLSGRFVKDEAVAVDIIKDLAHRSPTPLLFKKEKYTHSYPHCWRCKTPLIYYARDSWYIKMSSLRDKLVAANESINWEPAHIKEGRFGEWLREIKDWAISRERYWGTPLPIWTHSTSSGQAELKVIGSIDELKKYAKKSGNKYFVMRHGEAESNVKNILDTVLNDGNHLTEKGKQDVVVSATELKSKNIDVIIASPFTRTTETAHIVAETLGIDPSKIVFDKRLYEVNVGVFDKKPIPEWEHDFPPLKLFTEAPEGGETLTAVRQRIGTFMYDIEQTYQNKNILIVTHGDPSWMLIGVVRGSLPREIVDFRDAYFKKAEIREIDFVPLPHNENYELDLHRPYIDDLELVDEKGEQMTRVKEVMDVWFDSGAMPFAQDHYPFENKEWVDGPGYPADFISEAIDQTRGWFYTLHAIGVLTGRGAAFKNVICLGHILDAEGKKMSKSLGNIVDPWAMIEKYGADTLRLWMYSVNQPGESKNFDEKTVHELHNKVFTLLYNVLAFYELYRDREIENNAHSTNSGQTSSNVLDVWIAARLNQLVEITTNGLENYKLLEPVRAMRDFVDDLSTWYLRRSRDRIKDGDQEAKQTLYLIFKTLAKVMAPFAPFAAEDIWQKLKTSRASMDGARHDFAKSDPESVHLAEWPKSSELSDEIITRMQLVRDFANQGNALRKKANIPVRQPLATFFITELMDDSYHTLLKDELNVKAVRKGDSVLLDETITPELKREGDYRELVRAVQDMRKKAGLTPNDIITLTLSSEYKETVTGFEDELKKTVTAKNVSFADLSEKIKIEK